MRPLCAPISAKPRVVYERRKRTSLVPLLYSARRPVDFQIFRLGQYLMCAPWWDAAAEPTTFQVRPWPVRLPSSPATTSLHIGVSTASSMNFWCAR